MALLARHTSILHTSLSSFWPAARVCIKLHFRFSGIQSESLSYLWLFWKTTMVFRHKSHPEKLALSTSVCDCVHLHHQHTVAYLGLWGACGADADIFRYSWLKVLQCLCCACVASTCVFISTGDLLRPLLPSPTLDLLHLFSFEVLRLQLMRG